MWTWKWYNYYLLYLIENHAGTINFGHYYAYIKLNDKTWYEFNDYNVSKIGNINTSSTTDYTLFYKKYKILYFIIKIQKNE